MAKKKEKKRPPASAKSKRPEPTEEARLSSPVPVVGIGASAGGLDAFKKLFAAMPIDSGVAFVLIPHLDPKHESLMVELIARQTKMKVVEAQQGMAVAANYVYIIPPNKYMTIQGGVLRLTGPVERASMQTSIDPFLRSLADDQFERAICIILSGTGAHGSLGLKAIKAAGGMAMVQEPTTAEFPRMPQSAIATGLADYVLPVEEMPKALVQYVNHFYVNGGSHTETSDATDNLNQVLAVLRTRTKFDFRCYRKGMLRRRIERRMGLNHFAHIEEYLTYLREHADEVKRLVRDLHISVTSFFRDPEALEALAENVIAPLVAAKDHDAALRVWVPGCATGEEAYTVAILALEECARAQKQCRLQIFATDVDEDALESARHGVYPESIAADVSSERLKRFFTRADEGNYRINKPVREAVVFAAQNLIADTPFSKVDLVSCRNLLIYLEPEVQKKVVAVFHFALNPGGYLLLGPSEAIGGHTDLFEIVSKKWRIFRRIGPYRPERVEIPIQASMESRPPLRRPAETDAVRPTNFADLTQRVLIDTLGPTAVLINRKHEVLYFLGPVARYLDMPTGTPTHDVLALAREGLRSPLRGAIRQAIDNGELVRIDDVQIRRDGGYQRVALVVRPINGAKNTEGLLLIVFQDRADTSAPATRAEPADEAPLVKQLEHELRTTKEDLQSTIEEMESANEELKAANEEVMSMNEEMQSSNEELETSKEEMQSLNEELTTVNSQLQDKVEQLERAHNDLANLLACTEIATLFLDAELRIRTFTPAATRMLNVVAHDVNRPITDIKLRFSDGNLLNDIEQVMRTLLASEKEVCLDDGHWCLRRITPYRTAEKRIEGVVLTFTDVTGLKVAFNKSNLLATVLRSSRDAVIVHDLEGHITHWNHGAELLYGYRETEALQMNIQQLIPAKARVEYADIVERIKRGASVDGWESQRITKSGQVLDVWITPTALLNEAGRPFAIAKTDRDITERKRQQASLEAEVERRTAELHEQEARLRAILNSPGDAIITIDHQGTIDSVNAGAEHMFGYTTAELVGRNVNMLMPSPYYEAHDLYLKHYLETGEAHIIGIGREVKAKRKDGSTFWIDLSVSKVEGRDLFTGIIRDISRRKDLEREVVEISALEQQRIGQDLHDECGQQLTALGLMVGTLSDSSKDRSPPVEELRRKIAAGLAMVLRHVRNIAQGLALSEVKAAELPTALQELTERLGETSGIRLRFEQRGSVRLTDNIVATHFYHIAQEACTNALKHAKPLNIAVRLTSKNQATILEIRDDGTGIPTDGKNGLGMRIMRNRASVIGAKLSIVPAEPNGTLITCTLSKDQRHDRK